jgi:hypothetical protein
MIETSKPSFVEFIRRRGLFVGLLLLAVPFIISAAIILFVIISVGGVSFGLLGGFALAVAGVIAAAMLMRALIAARRRKRLPLPTIAPLKPSLMETIYRRGRFVCLLLIAATAIVFVRSVVMGISMSQAPDPGTFFLLWLALITLSVATVFFSRKLPKLRQKRRDNYALSIFNALERGTVQEFAVFLRPFYLTGQIAQTVEGFGSDSTTTYGFEVEMIGALAELMPALALGRPGEAIGVGRIQTDDSSWKTAAAELMSRASLILCVPSAHHGTAWELEQIVQNGYLAKTLFFMPISISSFSSLQQQREDWNLVVEFMGRFGVSFPRYREVSPINRSEANYQMATLGAAWHDLRAAHWSADQARRLAAEGVLFSVNPDGGLAEEDVDLQRPETLRNAIQRLRSTTAAAMSLT